MLNSETLEEFKNKYEEAVKKHEEKEEDILIIVKNLQNTKLEAIGPIKEAENIINKIKNTPIEYKKTIEDLKVKINDYRAEVINQTPENLLLGFGVGLTVATPIIGVASHMAAAHTVATVATHTAVAHAVGATAAAVVPVIGWAVAATTIMGVGLAKKSQHNKQQAEEYNSKALQIEGAIRALDLTRENAIHLDDLINKEVNIISKTNKSIHKDWNRSGWQRNIALLCLLLGAFFFFKHQNIYGIISVVGSGLLYMLHMFYKKHIQNYKTNPELQDKLMRLHNTSQSLSRLFNAKIDRLPNNEQELLND